MVISRALNEEDINLKDVLRVFVFYDGKPHSECPIPTYEACIVMTNSKALSKVATYGEKERMKAVRSSSLSILFRTTAS